MLALRPLLRTGLFMKKIGRPSTGIRERLLDRAFALFYSQGFAATGIAQIAEEARTTKASFYQHFSSKDELASAYIDHYGNYLLGRVQKLAQRYPDPAQFFPAWVRLIRTDIRLVRNFSGCPIVVMADHTDLSNTERRGLIREMAARWLKEMAAYLRRAKELGHIPDRIVADRAARRVLNSYEGAIAMWKLTGDLRHISDVEEQFLSAAGLDRTRG